jgi:hypothetical protein
MVGGAQAGLAVLMGVQRVPAEGDPVNIWVSLPLSLALCMGISTPSCIDRLSSQVLTHWDGVSGLFVNLTSLTAVLCVTQARLSRC